MTPLAHPPLRSILRDPAFARGARELGGTALGIGAWGMVTGVAMVKTGMPVPLAILFSLAVYAGSAQLVALPLMVAGSPVWMVLLAATCVNLRFIILSTFWRHYFGGLPLRWRCVVGYFSGDIIFVNFLRRFPVQAPEPGQLPYFWGAAGVNWVAWQCFSISGILLGDAVPVAWGLGFAGTLALVGVLCAMLEDRIQWAAAAVAGAAAIACFALPLRLNLIVAVAAAVAAGLLIERLAPVLRALRGGPAP